MFESKKVGRGLSAVAGGTLGYLINRVQDERMPADILGYTIKTTASFFLAQYAYSKDEELILRSVIGYWAYESMRLTPIGKPPKTDIITNESLKGIPQGATTTEIAKKNPSETGGIFTPQNMENMGSALRGITSFLSGFKGN
jgi:hypothetical protein